MVLPLTVSISLYFCTGSISQAYQCRAGKRGALLSLPYGGHREDVIRIKVFEDYIKDNVDRWFYDASRFATHFQMIINNQ